MIGFSAEKINSRWQRTDIKINWELPVANGADKINSPKRLNIKTSWNWIPDPLIVISPFAGVGESNSI
jgi:hypothetical protein